MSTDHIELIMLARAEPWTADLSHLLHAQGHTVHIASTPAHVLELLSQYEASAVLADCETASLAALELLARLRRDQPGIHTLLRYDDSAQADLPQACAAGLVDCWLTTLDDAHVIADQLLCLHARPVNLAAPEYSFSQAAEATGLSQQEWLEVLMGAERTEAQQLAIARLRASRGVCLVQLADRLQAVQLQQNPPPSASTPVQLRGLVRELLKLIRPELSACQTELHIHLDQQIPEHLMLDAPPLQQVLINLLICFAQTRQHARLDLHIHQQGAALVFAFTLNGQRLPDHMSRVLGDNQGTHRASDSGYGLLLSQMISRQLGGDLVLNQQTAEGCSLELTIPVSPVQALAAPPHILVVDDCAISRQVVEQMLSRAGYQVSLAESGAAALQACAAQTFALVLMDVCMPGMNGPQATRQIRQLAGYGNTPVLAMTAYSEESELAECRAAGMQPGLTKPVNASELEEHLLAALSGKQVLAQAPAAAESGVLDNSSLEQLASDISWEAMPELVKVFCTDLEQRLAALEADYAAAELVGLERQFHTLGSSAALYGLQALSEQARSFERVCGQGELPAKQDLAGFQSLAVTSRQALEAAVQV